MSALDVISENIRKEELDRMLFEDEQRKLYLEQSHQQQSDRPTEIDRWESLRIQNRPSSLRR